MIDKRQQFEVEVLPHIDAAYNLARWLVRDEHMAEDIVQDAYLRAFQYYGGFRDGPARPWLLAIVRNVCHNWFAQRKRSQDTRRKILVGAMLLEWMGKDAEVQRQMLGRLDGFLTREDDRSLFGLAGGSKALVEKAIG